MQINREDIEINFAELLAQRCAASAEEAITLGTGVSLGIREYKDKKGFVPAHRENLNSLLAQSRQKYAQLDREINALVESGFELEKMGQVAGKHGYSDANALLENITTSESSADTALFQQAVIAHDEFERFYNEQPHMQKMGLWNGAPPEDMKEAIRKTFGQIATAESPIKPLGLDAPLYRQDMDKERAEVVGMESEKATYPEKVKLDFLNYNANKEEWKAPEGREWVKEMSPEKMTKEQRQEVYAFAEKVSGKDDKNELMAQFVNSTPEDRLVMHRENESEEGRKGLEELKSDMTIAELPEDVIQANLERYTRLGKEDRSYVSMGFKAFAESKKQQANELASEQ